MAYSDVAALAADLDFQLRTSACVATEDPGGDSEVNPPGWAADHAWQMAAQPGFGDAYASALAGGVERPGNDPSVITDAQVLSAVQSLMGENTDG